MKQPVLPTHAHIHHTQHLFLSGKYLRDRERYGHIWLNRPTAPFQIWWGSKAAKREIDRKKRRKSIFDSNSEICPKQKECSLTTRFVTLLYFKTAEGSFSPYFQDDMISNNAKRMDMNKTPLCVCVCDSQNISFCWIQTYIPNVLTEKSFGFTNKQYHFAWRCLSKCWS